MLSKLKYLVAASRRDAVERDREVRVGERVVQLRPTMGFGEPPRELLELTSRLVGDRAEIAGSRQISISECVRELFPTWEEATPRGDAKAWRPSARRGGWSLTHAPGWGQGRFMPHTSPTPSGRANRC